ncbi:SIR2 family NAD-dependent protein deacylase [Dictyobacter aurantiacus]|uniref:protein acetyllysine N-acetyltransferase n=1 Tax=Dictyobacter aurantiacus TaxID=1936993 RepID=A0A401Z818_9CHLR|nr:Sir2 family NAD-dependent protein deacetylase [Dictyobacter aurantiacus]GCE03010.1 NAD-dependent protein deacetylase [Dictyobacter aurantiacus]
MFSLEEQIQDAVELLQEAHQIVALTGAGISTESGIPDFRSPGSIWQQVPPVNYRDFISKPEARRQYWQTRRELSGKMAAARPNAAHRALATLEREQRLLGVITQNFDGLHQEAGNRPERVIELHGTSHQAACTLCGRRSSMAALQRRIDAGEPDPTCAHCGGYLKAATILFGQRVPDAELQRAKALANSCDLFLVIGSSLKVVPASMLPRLALRRNVPIIIINQTPTSLDTVADVAIHASAGRILSTLIAQL